MTIRHLVTAAALLAASPAAAGEAWGPYRFKAGSAAEYARWEYFLELDAAKGEMREQLCGATVARGAVGPYRCHVAVARQASETDDGGWSWSDGDDVLTLSADRQRLEIGDWAQARLGARPWSEISLPD